MDSLQMEFLEVCSMGDVSQVTAMLRSGRIDPRYRHKINGWTALHWAARRGHTDVVYQLLNAGFDPHNETADGKTALDVAHPDSDPELRALLAANDEDDRTEAMSSGTENSAPASPNYKKNPPFPYAKKSSSFDHGGCTVGPDSPTSPGYYSYGRRDSTNRTRFLLVRTSCANGKEAFKRITLPGGGTVDFLKTTIERSMRLGAVRDVLLLPDRVLVEHDEQLSEFADCQKVEVIFDPDAPLSSPQPPAVRKASLTDRMDRRSPSKIPMLSKKSKSVVEEKLNGRSSEESTPSPTPQNQPKIVDEIAHVHDDGHDPKDDADDESSDLSSSLTLSERDEFVTATIKLSAEDTKEQVDQRLSESPTATTSFSTSVEESACVQQLVKPLTQDATETIMKEAKNAVVASEPIEELEVVSAETEAQKARNRKIAAYASFAVGVAGFSALAYMGYMKFKRA
uniref:ANK_REP_REGION domain-containing protein n=1 Tax=Steinernema glaseri TaxID=37863 RepID=A0A1I7Y1E5_9BILA